MILISSDGKRFPISAPALKQSTTLAHLMVDVNKDSTTDTEIRLPNIESSILHRCIQHMEKYKEAVILIDRGDEDPYKCVSDAEIGAFRANILSLDLGKDKLGFPVLLDLILAANFLALWRLLHQCCKVYADEVRNKDVTILQAMFGTEEKITQEEFEAGARAFNILNTPPQDKP